MFTPLYKASLGGNLEVVQCLIQEGKTDVNQADEDGYTPLYVASKQGYLTIVEYLIQEGKANVNQAANSGRSPLSMASQNAHLEVVQCLIQEGKAKVNLAKSNSITPLSIALMKGYLTMITLLVVHGAEIPRNREINPMVMKALWMREYVPVWIQQQQHLRKQELGMDIVSADWCLRGVHGLIDIVLSYYGGVPNELDAIKALSEYYQDPSSIYPFTDTQPPPFLIVFDII